MNQCPLPELRFQSFLRFDEVSEFVHALAAARPDVISLRSIGMSREGRDLFMLVITDPTTGGDEGKPSYLVHGNIHAAELSGTHAALYTARQLVADPGCADMLKRVAFYIVPRINPDGAEFVVTTSGSVRSRTDRSTSKPNTLYQEDINGDGLILTMRRQHPDGAFAIDPEEPRLLIQRTKDSKPPFYHTVPEGMIHDWDGSERFAVEGRGFDWNRNWSYDWRPEPEQSGAGDFPFSEPEMRSLAEFIHSHPKLFGILGYHNGPNGTLRPPSTGADTDLDQGDVLMMEKLARIGSEHTGFPIVPVVKYHRKYARDINLRGHFHNFGYHHLGLFVFEFELGTIVNSAGISTEEIFAVKDEQEYEALMRKVIRWWDQQQNKDPVFMPWTPFAHPQLGAVEIGGLLRRHMAGPTMGDLRTICENTYKFTLDHAAYHPSVIIEDLETVCIEGGTYRIRARVANRGELPTHVSNKGRGLRRLEQVRVEFHAASGVTLLSCEGHRTLGHLGGLTDSRTLEWFVQARDGAGTLCELALKGGTGGDCTVTVPGPAGPSA